jgi:hypothetical protein
MFANNNHSLVGGKEDPKDGPKVAAAVFSAVVVYAVSVHSSFFVSLENPHRRSLGSSGCDMNRRNVDL